ncbi:uncharacterized protein ATC70_004827 [Mucor velutinosus]|uniref:Uncharacterized protein n=1 Tax=Mucor velutinosus TaxID=708070 RepID=A0AAN7HXA9_9FUNG|nr:hypothetical protein ATC70_004827 [Mucor velutinosus]
MLYESTARHHQTHRPQEQSTKLYSVLVSTHIASSDATKHHNVIADHDAISDTESISSFHTASDCPTPVTLNPDKDADMEQQTEFANMDALLREQDNWTQELEFENMEIEKIAWAVGAKKAELKELELKQLEYRACKSFIKNNRITENML